MFTYKGILGSLCALTGLVFMFIGIVAVVKVPWDYSSVVAIGLGIICEIIAWLLL